MCMYNCVWNVFFAQCKLHVQFKYLASVYHDISVVLVSTQVYRYSAKYWAVIIKVTRC